MDGMNPFSTDQWIHQYPNTTMVRSASHEPSDQLFTSIPVYNSSHETTDHNQAAPKPIRRRSRASRRTPVTVLNASPTDFRALVQRFTGCDSNDNLTTASASSAVSLPTKGPVNIDFARNHDATEQSSSRYMTYFDNNQVRSSSSSSVQGDHQQVQPMGGWSHLQGGYGMENNASVMYESIDESSLMQATERDGGNHGYNV